MLPSLPVTTDFSKPRIGTNITDSNKKLINNTFWLVSSILQIGTRIVNLANRINNRIRQQDKKCSLNKTLKKSKYKGLWQLYQFYNFSIAKQWNNEWIS